MNIVMIKICLSLLLLVVVLRIKNSSQNVYSDEESIDQCIIHASEYDELETDQKKYNSKACGAVVKCHPNEMSIALPKALLHGVNHEDLRLLDSNCTATDNNTHIVFTTTLIGCGTSSRHTNKSVVYSNMVRQVFSETAVITRAPEVNIYFSCHYSKYSVVSSGAVNSGRGKDMNGDTRQDFASNDNVCWNNRFLFHPRNPTCPRQ